MRIISAAVILPLAVAAIWFGSLAFAVMVLLIAAAMGWELSRLCQAAPGVALLVTAAFLLATALSLLGFLREAVICAAGTTVVVAAISRFCRIEAPWILAAGVAYISVALLSIVWLRAFSPSGLTVFCWMVAVVVATDVGAYFAGRKIGGPKLAPRISPAKTWSGLLGGAVCASAAGIIVVAVSGTGTYLWVGFASALLAGVAQIGDLIESGVKRHVGVKDAGNLIPGHGGVLDRLDGFLTVAPATVLMAWFAGGSPLEWQ